MFYIRDYNYDLSTCDQATSDYMNQVLSNSDISLSGYVELYTDDGRTVGYRVRF